MLWFSKTRMISYTKKIPSTFIIGINKKTKLGKTVIFTQIQLQYTTFQFYYSITIYYKIITIGMSLSTLSNSITIISARKNKFNKW